MIANERATNIHQDLEKLEKVLRIFMREDIFSKLDEHTAFQENLSKQTQEIKIIVDRHDTFIKEDEDDYLLDEAKDKLNGIIYQYGMRFDHNGTMLRMNRPQM
jgi:hypothetical protein